MPRDAEVVERTIDAWERKAGGLVADNQAELAQRRSLLELQLEANPLPFQPSPVLTQLIRNNRQPRSSKNAKQSKRNVEYLERKLEAEIRQHYELENAQHCAAWKKLHLQSVEARRVVGDQIERDFSALCLELQINLRAVSAPQQPDPTSAGAALSIEKSVMSSSDCIDGEREADEWLQAHLQQNWVAQERFNIQEAFTNQTRKLQADLDEYVEQLDADCESERQRVLAETSSMPVVTTAAAVALSKTRQQHADVFKSDAQRKMLLQSTAAHSTASWIDPLVDGSAVATAAHGRDVSATNRKLDELLCRLQTLKEAAEAARKERMAQIGRQCAHMFTQLDCRETEAKLAHLLAVQEAQEVKALARHVADLARRARAAC